MTTLPVGGGADGKSPILVRRGEAVGYCIYAMHRRKDIYGPDAEKFRPERWEGDTLKDIGSAYLPFNGGPRICLGRMPSPCFTIRPSSPIRFADPLSCLLRGNRGIRAARGCIRHCPYHPDFSQDYDTEHRARRRGGKGEANPDPRASQR